MFYFPKFNVHMNHSVKNADFNFVGMEGPESLHSNKLSGNIVSPADAQWMVQMMLTFQFMNHTLRSEHLENCF